MGGAIRNEKLKYSYAKKRAMNARFKPGRVIGANVALRRKLQWITTAPKINAVLWVIEKLFMSMDLV